MAMEVEVEQALGRDPRAAGGLRARLRARSSIRTRCAADRGQHPADAVARLFEEVTFDRSRVTSVDWASYPILPSRTCRRSLIDLVDRPQEPPLGAGEAAATPVAGGAGQRGPRRRGNPSAHRAVHAREGESRIRLTTAGVRRSGNQTAANSC